MDEKQLKEAAASLLKDPTKRDAAAQMIVEFTNPNHIVTDFVGMLMPTRTAQPGDILVKKVRKGIKVWTLVPGSIPLKSEITVSDRANYMIDGAVSAVTYNEWELNSGEIGTVESIRAQMEGQVRDMIQRKVFTALTTIYTAVNTPTNYTNVGAPITQAALDNAIRFINQNTATGAKTIVGTRYALEPIMGFVGWSTLGAGVAYAMNQNIQEELLKNGWVGSYRGVNLLVVPQVYDNPEDYNRMITQTKILVLGDNIGEFISYGGAQSSQYSDPKVVPPQWVLQTYEQFGMIVDKAEQIFVLDVT